MIETQTQEQPTNTVVEVSQPTLMESLKSVYEKRGYTVTIGKVEVPSTTFKNKMVTRYAFRILLNDKVQFEVLSTKEDNLNDRVADAILIQNWSESSNIYNTLLEKFHTNQSNFEEVEKGNKNAGRRLRKFLLETRNYVQDLRMQVYDIVENAKSSK